VLAARACTASLEMDGRRFSRQMRSFTASSEIVSLTETEIFAMADQRISSHRSRKKKRKKRKANATTQKR